MARITSLSVEIHRIILEEVQISTSPADYRAFLGNVGRLIEERRLLIEPNSLLLPPEKPLSSNFPYNIALTCRLWRDILAGVPNQWNHITFDVTFDPSPLLDAFSWAGREDERELIVFTSATHPTEVVKAEERKRVAAISKALQPHIHRHCSITFNVMFASSLPSSTLFFSQDAPGLQILKLECLVDDTDTEIKKYNISDVEIVSTLSTDFGGLETLTLAGISFMDLCMLPGSGSWFKSWETHTEVFTLHVSRFCFQPNFENDAQYTMDNFTSGLSDAQTCIIHLSHLSLSYKWVDRPPALLKGLLPAHEHDLHFDAVSKDFLSAFFRSVYCYTEGSLSYSRCAIPAILQVQPAKELTLDSIIDDPQENENGVIENSLQRVLAVWGGNDLTVRSCPSFNNHLLKWLILEVEFYGQDTIDKLLECSNLNPNSIMYLKTEGPKFTFPGGRLLYLQIEDCTNYNFSQLRQFVDKNPVHALRLLGKKTVLDTEDINWIHRKKRKGSQKRGEGFLTRTTIEINS